MRSITQFTGVALTLVQVQMPVPCRCSITAFFYPALESDNNGNVAIRFTLPESVTTWKFMGLAHDKELRNFVTIADVADYLADNAG